MTQLTDIHVDWVSLVDRAAVRDPQNKSEPRRFLLWKREGSVEPRAERVLWKREGAEGVKTHLPTPEQESLLSAGAAMQRERNKESDMSTIIEKASTGEELTPAEQLTYLEEVSPEGAAKYKARMNLLGAGEDDESEVSKADSEHLSHAIRKGLREHKDEAHSDVKPRLSQIADLLDERRETGTSYGVSKRERRAAHQLVGLAKAQAAVGPLDALDSTAVAKASYDTQLAYLEEVSPAAAALYKQEREYQRLGRGAVQ
jgi:hypothetical protein